MSDGETVDLTDVVAGLERRLRVLEAKDRLASPPDDSPGILAGAGPWLRQHGWTVAYGFVAAIDLVAFALTRDWILLAGAVAMVLFAWLTVEP